MDRRSTSITVSFDAQTTRAINTKLTHVLKDESLADTVNNKGPPTSKKITHCSSKAAAEGSLLTSTKESLKMATVKGAAHSLTGDSGLMEKTHSMHLFNEHKQ